ncbi:MAG: hypothetical protein NTY19_20850 [Planctomycetota bacterium]|nr:hypothetical protein [Planctomycetota bacterium]
MKQSPKHQRSARAPHSQAASEEPWELMFVDETAFWSPFCFSSPPIGVGAIRAGSGIQPEFATQGERQEITYP